jgi:ACS family sodium-dependent inorganic phosphate cotransporter
VLAQVPAGWLVNRFGGRRALGWAVVLWSAATLVTPLSSAAGVGFLVAVRIVLGVAEAVVTPALYNLAARHLPRHLQSRAMSIMISGIALGTVTALAATGWFVARFHWHGLFYLTGMLGLLFAGAWFRWAPRPSLHDSSAAPGAGRRIPWRALLRSRAVWALIANHFCSNWSVYVLMAWMPTYLAEFRNLPISNASLLSALPWLFILVSANVVATRADRALRNGADVTRLRRSMQLTGLCGSALFILIAAFVDGALASILLLSLSLAALGFTWSGFLPNHLDIAPRYADVLSGMSNTAGALSGLVSIAATGWIVEQSGTFAGALGLAAAVNIAGALIWAVFATGKRVID